MEIAKKIINNELVSVEKHILDTLTKGTELPNDSLVHKLSQYIFANGGKRIRPSILLLSSLALNAEIGNPKPVAKQQDIILAACLEMIHTATLLHDDVVDNSQLRRGKATANTLWGNSASILVGDFFISKAFQLIADLKNMDVIRLLATTTNTMAEAEILQLSNQYNTDVSKETYYKIINGKTSVLFSAAAELAAISLGAEEKRQQLKAYGTHLGNAFQINDDILDYCSSTRKLGKEQGDDLKEGKITLPLQICLANSSPAQKEKLINFINKADLAQVLHYIEQTNALAEARQIAKYEVAMAKQAINSLNHSVYKEALINLADFTIQRDS